MNDVPPAAEDLPHCTRRSSALHRGNRRPLVGRNGASAGAGRNDDWDEPHQAASFD